MFSRFLRPASIAAVIALALAACDTPEERAEKHMQRGLALMESGDEIKAQLEFRNVLKADRDNAPARFALGDIAERRGDLRGAVAQYRRVAEADPRHVDARLRLARLMLLGGAMDEAITFADAAYALAPENVEVLSTRAALLYRAGDVEAALDAARTAVAADDEAVGSHIVLLAHQLETEGPDAVEPAVDALLERMPEDRALHVFKLRIAGMNGDVAAVEAQLARMIEVFPDEPQLRRALAQSMISRGDPASAEEQLRALAAFDPADAKAALDVARLILGVRGPDAAREEVRRLIDAAPNVDASMPFRLAEAELVLRGGDADAARALLEAAAAGAETRSVGDEARLQLARLALAQDDGATASELVATVLEGDPDNVDGLAIRASLALEALDTESAILDLRRAQNLAPDNPQLFDLEARAHAADGNVALEGERLATAARVSDFEPQHALRYARHLLDRGQNVAAESALAESARRNPADRNVLGALAELRLRMGDTAGARQVAEQLRGAAADGDQIADRVTAAALATQGRLEEGIDLLEQIVTDQQESDSALNSLISAYVQAGERERAESFLDDLIERNPANLRALALRAELHLMAGQRAEAETVLRAMVERRPDAPAGYLLMTRYFAQLGRADDAEAIAREGAAKARPNDEIRLSLAALLEQRDAFDEAIDLYRDLFETLPNSVLVANNLASLLAEYRYDDPEAMAFAGRVARRLRESDVPFFQDTYGWIAFLRGDTEEAVRHLVPAAQALPDNALVLYHLGRAYAAAGEVALARANLEEALRLAPNFPKAASARETLDGLPLGQ
jgi:cellulose synthase operon protein C